MSRVCTTSGVVEGITQDRMELFLGIPHIKDPKGELRWRSPIQNVWTGVYKADKFGLKFCQPNFDKEDFWYKEFYYDKNFYSECSQEKLDLNIWIPKERKGKCPVAVWIHGGAFMSGYNSEMEIDGKEYCDRGVILVTLSYRLGVFGFLAVAEESLNGNYGLMDVVMGLRWVKENIGKFGGDSENITIFGQSAGSILVQLLCLMDETDGLFHKAILQSGICNKSTPYQPLACKCAKKYGRKFVDYCGGSVSALRKMSAKSLLYKASNFEKQLRKTKEKIPFFLFAPIIDGKLLKYDVEEGMKEGHMKKIPYIVGSTMNDMWIGEEDTRRGKKGVLYEACEAWCNSVSKKNKEPAYLYYFTRKLPGDEAGAFHTSDLWYTFGTLNRSWRPFAESDYVLSRTMIDAWCCFIKTGNPEKAWKAYGVSNDHRIFGM